MSPALEIHPSFPEVRARVGLPVVALGNPALNLRRCLSYAVIVVVGVPVVPWYIIVVVVPVIVVVPAGMVTVVVVPVPGVPGFIPDRVVTPVP